MIRLLPAFLIFVVVGCGRGAVSPVGTWVVEIDSSKVVLDQQEKVEGLTAFFSSLTIELKKGGEAVLKQGDDERTTTWTQDGNRIVLNPPAEGGDQLVLVLEANGKTMRPEFSEKQLEEMSGLSVRFVKK